MLELEVSSFDVLTTLHKVSDFHLHELEEVQAKAKSLSEDKQEKKRRPTGESLRQRDPR